MSWQFLHAGKENDNFALSGVRVWQHEWRWQSARTVRLPDPFDIHVTYPFMICEIGSLRAPVRFAAYELPSGLWAFYGPS